MQQFRIISYTMKLLFFLLVSSSCSAKLFDKYEDEMNYHFEPIEEEDRAVLFKIMNVKKPRLNSLKDSGLWPNGILYFFFNENLTPDLLEGLRYAINKIEHYSCIRFSKLERNQIGFSPYLNISLVPQRVCRTTVGFSPNGIFKKVIGRNVCSPGTLIHEFLHALGFYHEHTRADRDSKVTVILDNLKSSNTQDNFRKVKFRNTQDLKVPYDFHSILHYTASAFGKIIFGPNWKPSLAITIRPHRDFIGAEDLMGQRILLTSFDIAKVNRLYQCDGKYQANELYPPKPRNIGI